MNGISLSVILVSPIALKFFILVTIILRNAIWLSAILLSAVC